MNERFRFGENWSRFLATVDERRISDAVESLQRRLSVDTLSGKRFLDIGSGSGLFSLAALRLGATVHSFDYDAQSVACANELKARYCAADPRWTIEQGSVLDRGYLARLGTFDVVYSWGVLHHTGAMLDAIDNAAACVADGGRFFIALYNDQDWVSDYWTWVKRTYCRYRFARAPLLAFHAPYLLLGRWLARALTGRLRVERGMTLWYDFKDWIGGYPFETATPEAVIEFCAARGLSPEWHSDVGRRHGCNEFVFRRGAAS